MISRILQQAAILVYLFLTLCALSYTLTRIVPFNIPWPFITHHYAMMAPFQNYNTHISELIFEGQRSDGSWVTIDDSRFFPHSIGETSIRKRFSTFYREKNSKYYELAGKMLELQREAGTEYRAVRLVWEKWPKSQYGMFVRRTPEETIRTPVIQYP